MFRIVLTLFFFGAIFGTLGDFSHVLSNTLGYPSPFYPLPTGQPLWVPFLFGSATVAIGLGIPLTDPWLRNKPPRQLRFQEILIGILAFLTFYGISGFLPLQPIRMRDGILSLAALTLWFLYDRTWEGFLQAAIAALCGTATEIFISSQGLFHYETKVAHWLGVPSWLPWLYFSASIVVGNLARWMLKFQKKLTPGAV